MFQKQSLVRLSGLMVAVGLVLGACSPAPASAPATAAPPAAKPTEAPKPAAAAAPSPSASPAAAAKPAEAPKPAAATFDEKAVADFYRGKTLRIVVGSAPGGGYDSYARLVARYLGKYTPGEPTVVVENMAGAGSLIAANHVYNAAPKDGTSVAHFQGSLALQQLFGASGVEIDMTKMQYLGAPMASTWVLAVTKDALAKTGVTKLEDTFGPNGKRLVLGANAPGDTNHDAVVILQQAMSANLKAVDGYDGTAKVRLAMQQGEVDGGFFSWESLKTSSLDEIQKGTWVILVQMSERPLKDLPNAPTIASMIKTEDQKQFINFGIVEPTLFLRPFAVAPGVPQDRAAALEAAFTKTVADPQFLAEAQKAKLDIAPVKAADIRKALNEYLNMPTQMKDRLKQVAGEKKP